MTGRIAGPHGRAAGAIQYTVLYLELKSLQAKLTQAFIVSRKTPSRYGSARPSNVTQHARTATLPPIYLTNFGM